MVGVEAKSILRTNILGALLDSGARVVLFVKSKERADFYRAEYDHQNLYYEVVEKPRLSRLNGIFEFVRQYLIQTKTMRLYKRLVYEESRNRLRYMASSLATMLLARPAVRQFVRFLDYRLCWESSFDDVFHRYEPDCVFLSNLFSDIETSMLRAARARGIRTIGFINSWDKTTSRGSVRLHPDTLIVPSDFVLEDALRFVDIQPERIVVSGPPQYDDYTNTDGIISREDFFKKIKMDSRLPLVVFSPMGSTWSDSDWDMIDLFHNEMEKRAQRPYNFFVRFLPNDSFDARHAERPWLRYDIPGVRFGALRGMDWDMRFDELRHLKNTLYHASLFVSYASSLAIDAALFDKPIINIGFEVRNGQGPFQTPTRRYETEHYSRGLLAGGIHMAKSKEELVEWIDRYLEDPSIDRSGRERLVREQCSKVDGTAGARIAAAILGER